MVWWGGAAERVLFYCGWWTSKLQATMTSNFPKGSWIGACSVENPCSFVWKIIIIIFPIKTIIYRWVMGGIAMYSLFLDNPVTGTTKCWLMVVHGQFMCLCCALSISDHCVFAAQTNKTWGFSTHVWKRANCSIHFFMKNMKLKEAKHI